MLMRDHRKAGFDEKKKAKNSQVTKTWARGSRRTCVDDM